MRQDTNRPERVISVREGVLITIALVVLAGAVSLFAFGIIRFNGGGAQAEAALPPTPSLTPVSPLTVATATPLLGPTAEPTSDTVIHTVQPGETLTTIAALYSVDLQSLLDANGLALNSVLQVGQTVIVPLRAAQPGTWHVVQYGETLTSIASQYGVTPELIQAANSLPDVNAIYVGQRLRIPTTSSTSQPLAGTTATSTPPPQTPQASVVGWPRSILDGDLNANYPLLYEGGRFRLHYQPGTYTATHLEETVALVEQALNRVEATLDVHLDGSFDLYMAGTLFASPNAHLHGLSQSLDRRTFVLNDGSGTPADRAYFLTHELTHLVAWNTWGAPSSTMLSEGLATYVGRPLLEQGGYLPYDQVCLAAYASGQLPSVATVERDWQAFQGHIRHSFNYFGSACFIDYLIDTYGLEPLSRLYHTSDYVSLYGKSLRELDVAWQEALAARQSELTVDPAALTAYIQELELAYDFVFDNYNGTDLMQQAYLAIDQARVAVWKGDFTSARRWLDEVYALTSFTP
jgi:LysM repeat protein